MREKIDTMREEKYLKVHSRAIMYNLCGIYLYFTDKSSTYQVRRDKLHIAQVNKTLKWRKRKKIKNEAENREQEEYDPRESTRELIYGI